MSARRCIHPCTVSILSALAILVPLAASAQARSHAHTGTPAPFTAPQAALGKRGYAENCASCHGQTLSGGEFASALDGNAFSQNWGGKPLAALVNFVRTRMPPAKPGSLSPELTAQIVAYVIAVNGGHAGSTELPTAAAALAAFTIPRSPLAPTPPMMPLSPLAPPARPVILPNPLDHITPVSDALIEHPPASEWLLWRRTYDDQGFSPLREIDRGNVARLRLVWAWSLPIGPDDATPLEHDGVLFVDSYGDNVQALNAATGDLLWQYSRALPLDAQPAVKRNLAIYRDRLLVPTSDDHVVALDVKTGAVVWDSAVADYRKAWRVTGGPLVAQGRVMQGVAGQSPGGGSIVGLDFASGRKLWTFYTIARPGAPGGASWNGLPLEKRNGASVWTAGSYDAQLHLAYFGVGQTYDTGPLLHPLGKPGITNDGLYTDSTLAIDPDTGRLAWYFQHLPNDQWDLDWAFEQQLIPLPVDGTMRKLVVTSGKMAIYEGMDAASGRYIFSKDLGLQNVVTAIDPSTGRKTINPQVVVGDGKAHTICPHAGAGRSWIATSYDATSGVLYIPMNEACMDLIPAPPGERPNLSSGVDWFIRPTPQSDGKFGRLEAFSLWTRQPVWTDRQRAPQTSCVLATAGGVVFAGALDRYLRAYDAQSGRLLWKVRLNDVPTSCPISYRVAGKQYLAIVVGHGGPLTQTYPVLVPEIQNPPQPGAAVWVFALPDANSTGE
ncbi:MAG TPA: PQQ-binding-like beta-propeller repeat protein [Steroidobacteraceae bacterium]|nr:PQQ-binding-like beta-propeller repeat protein [Steroidobacteraceae bacterium]